MELVVVSFKDIQQAYNQSRHGTFELHVVHHPGIESLYGVCNDFASNLADNGLDPEIIKVGRSELYRLRRLTTCLPMPYTHPDLHIVEIRDRLNRLSNDVNYASAKRHLVTAIDVCEKILADPSNPLEQELSRLLSDGTVVVTKDQPMRDSLMRWVSDSYSALRIQVMSLGDIRNLTRASKIVFLLSPTYASFRFGAPDWRFARDPKAMESHFIMYPFGETEIEVPGLLPGTPPLRKISSRIPLQVPHFDKTFDSETEWTVDERKAASRNTGNLDELVPGKYVRLAGGFSTFLEADTEASVFTVTYDSTGHLDVLKEPVHSLEADRFIVLRVEGTESDFIHDEADRLGAAQFRTSQRRWQDALKLARRNEGSLTRMREHLKSNHGLDNTGLVDWLTNPRRIGPGSYSDFVKLCEYLQLSNECDTLWEELKKIRGFHLQAGASAARTLRNMLELRDMNDPELQDPGYLIIDRSADGLGKIGLYRILQIGEVHLVDALRLGAIERVEPRGTKDIA